MELDLHKEIPLQRMTKYSQAFEVRVIEIAKSQGGTFGVSPRYRDIPIRSVCKRLKKKGIFKQVEYGVFEVYKLIT